jgi:hypothetical protein
MEVQFCELCSESVPLRDLDEGRAVRRGSRVICATCERAMGELQPAGESGAVLEPVRAAVPAPLPAAARAGASASGGGAALLVGGLALLVSASVAVIVFERLEAFGRAGAGDAARLRSEIAAKESELRQLAEARDALRAASEEELGLEVARLGARLDEERAANQRALSKIDALLSDLTAAGRAQGDLGTSLEAAERELARFAASLETMRADVGLVAERVLELELAGAADPAPAVPAAPAPSGASAEASAPPSWTGLLAELKSTSEGTRWHAVLALADTQDPLVVPHLLPMLKDPGIFVRMAAARVLADLGDFAAVPGLIDALEDEEASVREQAYSSLRKLTGEDIKFDALAGDAERAKRVKAWRDWWRRQGEG